MTEGDTIIINEAAYKAEDIERIAVSVGSPLAEIKVKPENEIDLEDYNYTEDERKEIIKQLIDFANKDNILFAKEG